MLGTTSATAQSSLIIFAQKYIGKCEDTYFILQNKFLCIYKDSLGAKILRDDCTHSWIMNLKALKILLKHPKMKKKIMTLL